MSWQILILISIVLFSVGTLLQRILMKGKESDPIAYSIVFQLLTGMIIASYGFLFANMDFPEVVPLANILLMTLLWTSANIFSFTAIKYIDVSRYTIVFSSRLFFTVIASSLFLGEFLTAQQWLGAILIFLSIYIITQKFGEKFTLTKYDMFSILAAMSFGFANTNDRFLLKTFDLYPYVTIAFIFPAIFTALAKPKNLRHLRVFADKAILKRMLFLCLFYSVSSLAFFRALQVAPNSSQVVAVNLTTVILTILLAVIFLKERENVGRKLLGAAISFIGLLLVG